MEEVGKEVAKEAITGFLKRVWGALRGGAEAKVRVGKIIELEAKAPSVREVKELLDHGAELQLRFLPQQTEDVLSKGRAKELEDPSVRAKRIKRKEDCDTLISASNIKALPKGERLRFAIFVLTSFGDICFGKRAFSDAEGAYKEAYKLAQELKHKPLQSICLNLLGAAVGMQEKHKEALDYFNEAIRLRPDLAEAWVNKGVALRRLGQHKEALTCYDGAIRLKPDDNKAWFNKGVALGDLGQHKEEITCYDEAIRLKPDDNKAWYNKGVTLGDLGQYKEALTCFDEAIRLKPDDNKAWYNKGVTLLFQGLNKVASADIKGAEEIALELIQFREKALKYNMAQRVEEAMARFKERLSKKQLKLFSDFELMVSVLAIADPVERWKALAKGISQRWTKGLSAVEAIRKERE